MVRVQGIRAVFFDYGNTLAHAAEPFDEMWARVARERGLAERPAPSSAGAIADAHQPVKTVPPFGEKTWPT